MTLSLYPPAAAFVALIVGVALTVSVPVALIVAGTLGLGGWLAYFVGAVKKAS